MKKYGFEFEPVPGRSGWFTSPEVSGEAALQAANRIGSQFDGRGSELVFCGRGQNDGDTDKLYLIGRGDPVGLVRDFEVGSHAADDENVVTMTHQMLRSIYAVARFTPIIVNPTAYEARFISHVDAPKADHILRAIERHGYQGMDYYASKYPDLIDQDIISSLVSDQRLHLWWD